MARPPGLGAVSWEAPEGTTHYDVTYGGNGTNARAAWEREGTSLEFTCDIRTRYENRHCVDAGAAYTVGVRAHNAAGKNDWHDSEPAAPTATLTLWGTPGPGGTSAPPPRICS